MSLLDDARRRVKRAGPSCKIKVIAEAHADRADEVADLLAAVPESIPFTVAADTLSEAFDLSVKPDSVSRHVRGKCGCEPA